MSDDFTIEYIPSTQPRGGDGFTVESTPPAGGAPPSAVPTSSDTERTDLLGSAPVPGPSIRDYTMDVGAGFNRGLAKMAPLFAGAIPAAATMIPGAGPQIASELVRRSRGDDGILGNMMSGDPARFQAGVTQLLGDDVFKPRADDAGGRMLGRTMEEVGTNVLPSAGILAAARGLAPLFSGARGVVQGGLLDPIRRSPGMASVGDAAATVGSGVGAGVAQEVAPGNTTAETWGQLVGGFTPAALTYTPLGLVGRGAKKIWSSFLSPDARAQATAKEFRSVMGQEITPAIRANLQEADRVGRRIPGFEPTLAQASDSPSLIATQTAIEKKAAGAELEGMAARHTANQQAVENFARGAAPTGDDDPYFVIDTANRRVEQARAGFASQEGSLQTELDNLANRLPGLGTEERLGVGETLRNSINAARVRARNNMANLSRQLGIDDADMHDLFSRIRANVQHEVGGPQSRFSDRENVPPILSAILQDQGGATTYRDIKALRERVTDDLRDAMSGTHPNARVARILLTIKNQIDDEVNALAGQPGEIGQRWAQFRDTYRAQYIEPFENKFVFKVRQTDSRGNFVTPNERIAQLFFQNRDISGARALRSAIGDDQEAVGALTSAAIDDLRYHAARDGVFDPAAFNRWVSKHRDFIEQFPEVGAYIIDANVAAGSILQRQGVLTARRQTLEDNALVRKLNSFAGGNSSPDKVIDAAIKDHRIMGNLQTLLGDDPAAMASLRRAVWNEAVSLPPGGIVDFIANNRRSLGMVLSPTHLRDLETIDTARAIVARVPNPLGSQMQPNMLENVERRLGTNLALIANRIQAFKQGRVEKVWLVTNLLTNMFKGKARTSMEDLMKKALYDKEFARDLAHAFSGPASDFRIGKHGEGSPAIDPRLARRLQARYAAMGIPAEEPTEE